MSNPKDGGGFVPDLSRREFLAGSLVAAGALAGCAGMGGSSWQKRMVPAVGGKEPIPEDQPIRIGIIGVGGMGNGHMNAFMGLNAAKNHKVHVVALSDVCKTRLDACLKVAREKQKGVCEVEAYRDYEQLLARDDIDAVLIASPEHWHAQMAVDAIAAKKDVYLEKPMTLRLADALWLEKVMDSNPDMRLQVGTQYMTYEKYHKAKEWIAAGRIGKPVFSQTSYCRNSVKGEWLYKIDERVAARRGARLGSLVRPARSTRMGHRDLPPVAPLPRLLDGDRRRPARAHDDADALLARRRLARPRHRQWWSLHRQGDGEPRHGQHDDRVREGTHDDRRWLDL